MVKCQVIAFTIQSKKTAKLGFCQESQKETKRKLLPMLWKGEVQHTRVTKDHRSIHRGKGDCLTKAGPNRQRGAKEVNGGDASYRGEWGESPRLNQLWVPSPLESLPP